MTTAKVGQCRKGRVVLEMSSRIPIFHKTLGADTSPDTNHHILALESSHQPSIHISAPLERLSLSAPICVQCVELTAARMPREGCNSMARSLNCRTSIQHASSPVHVDGCRSLCGARCQQTSKEKMGGVYRSGSLVKEGSLVILVYNIKPLGPALGYLGALAMTPFSRSACSASSHRSVYVDLCARFIAYANNEFHLC